MLFKCSFLVLLLGLSTVAVKSCRSSSQDCQCYGTQFEAEYNCMGGDYVIKVISKFDRVEIDCTNQDEINWDTAELPELELLGGNISLLRFRSCPLPKSFKQILNGLKINSIKVLHVDYSTDFENITLTSDYFQELNDLEKLELPNNNVKYIDKSVFGELKDLIDVDLKSNNVELTDYMFQHTSKLRFLELSQNHLDHLPTHVFENLTNLKYLYINNNNLNYISTKTFKSLNNLELLELSSNQINNISEANFNGLKSLKIINLTRNKLQHLPSTLFKNNLDLENVKINRNLLLATLPDYLFANLTNLKNVDVQECNLTVLPENLFAADVDLQTISFAKNKLESLPDKLFKDVENLQTLDLSFNNLTEFSIELFQALTNLKVLNLRNNNIVNLNKNIFKNLNSLEIINLENNLLEKIDRELLKNSNLLKEILLSNNRITISYNAAVSPFNGNLNIEKLYLSNNRITAISADWINSQTHLKELDLSHNQIDQITFDDIFLISTDVTIDLTYNNISNVDFKNAEQRVTIQDNEEAYKNSRFNKGTLVYLDNNPINCNCYLYDLIRYFDRSIDPLVPTYVTIEANNLTCASPPNFIGFEVKKLQPHMVTCTFDQLEVAPCSNICDCGFQPSNSALLINCENRNLTRVPQLTLPTDNFYNQTKVSLKYNLLTSGPVQNMGYENVTEMILSFNHINQFTWLPPKLKLLSLDNNNIGHIDLDMLTMLNSSRLTDITLGGNPYICDCSTANLSKFLVSHISTKEIDVSNIKCRNGGNTLVRLTINDLCPISQAGLYIGCSILVCVIVVICILVILFYRNEHQIKVWLYAHNMCLWFVTEQEIDKNKKYDAFISYSHKDEDFVLSKILSVLEEGPNPYKLCLHVRDWIPGESISKQIVRSVDESRRTLVILSPHFLESVWGTMEFRTAHTQAMSEGRARVIIVLYGDIDVDAQLDDELKAYINTNTYVKWGDPWFWDKLRYALPHSKSKLEKQRSQRNQNIAISLNDKLELVDSAAKTPNPGTTPPAVTLDPLLLKKHPLSFTTVETLTPPAESGLNPLLLSTTNQ